MAQVIDRPVADIIRSVQRLIVEGKIKGQFAKDLDKLCIYAARAGNKGEA